jgi:predicted transcriptional regulator
MRTTIHLPEDLLAQLKRIAADSHRTLTSVVEDAIRNGLARKARRTAAEPAALPTFNGGGLQPGIDLDDTASLLDRMDE